MSNDNEWDESALESRESNLRDQAIIAILRKYKNYQQVERAVLNQRKVTEHLAFDDTISMFLHEAGSFELLTKADELELFTIVDRGVALYQTLTSLGDLMPDVEGQLIKTAAAHQVIVVTNQRLVFDIAKRYGYSNPDWTMDLTQQGMIGLSKAINRFDVNKGFAFSTYATWWVRQEVTRYIGDASRTIRIPIHLHEKYIKMSSIVKALTMNLDREPTNEEIEEATGLKIKDYHDLMRNGSSRPASLDALSHQDFDKELSDYVADPNNEVDDYIDHISNMEELKNILVRSQLSDREKFVIGLRFGLDGEYFDGLIITVKNKTISYKAARALMGDASSFTLEQVGTMFGLTRERVRQIESSGVKGLQAANLAIQRSFEK